MFGNNKSFLLWLLIISSMLVSSGSTLYFGNRVTNRGHYTGDSYSSDCAWQAGLNFVKFGFLRLHFLPVTSRISDLPGRTSSDLYSLHYLAGSDLIQGVLFRLGINNRFTHRLFVFLISWVGAGMALRCLLRLVDPVFATLAWVIYILSPSFIFFSDVLFEFPYFIFLDWFFLSRVILFKEKLENSSSFSLSCWFWQFFGLGFLAVWFSLDEMIPFLSLSLVLWFVGDGRLGKVQRGSLVLAAVVGSALSFGIHIAQNASVLGGWYPAFENFHRVFQVRIGEIDTGDIHQKYSLAKHVGKYFLAMQWFYTWPMILLALTGWLMRLRHCLMNPAQGRFWLGLGLSTALGAFSWQILMRQHSMIHAFTVRHADIWVILGVANFLVFAKTNYQKVVAAVCGLIFLVHLPLCVLQIEGTFVKRTLICHLIASAERPAWACGQASAVFHSTELPGAKSIVQEMLPNSCAEVPAHPSGIRAIFSGVILYWR